MDRFPPVLPLAVVADQDRLTEGDSLDDLPGLGGHPRKLDLVEVHKKGPAGADPFQAAATIEGQLERSIYDDAPDVHRAVDRKDRRPGEPPPARRPNVVPQPRSSPSAGASATGQGPAIPSSAGQVGVGAEAIRPAPPESGPAGVVKHPEPAAQGPRGPNQGGATVCGGIYRRSKGWKGLYGPLMEGRPASAGASRRGIGRDWRSGVILGPSRSSPAPGPAVDRSRRLPSGPFVGAL